ncbi:MAG: sialate O-acetylesterase [Ignavibacteria bacterium]
MKKFLLIIYFFTCGSIVLINTISAHTPGHPVTWNIKPVTMQLFARESDDSADVIFSGSVNSKGYDSIYVELYRDGIYLLRKSQSLFFNDTIADFYITHRIKAELNEYSTKTYLNSGSTTVLIDFADSLVAGDTYLILGQSNAQTADTNVSFSSEYCRTFGVQTANTNWNSYSKKDTLWARSSAKYNGYNPLSQQQPRNVCVWGMWLQKNILDSCSIPTCIINGAVHSSGISLHQRKNSNPTDSSSIYGKTLYRVQKSGLASEIKSIFWYQGESDVVSPAYLSYANKFDSLYHSWKTDYPGVDKIFVMQVRPLACNGTSAFAQELRETQRKFQSTYPDVQMISTAGIGGYFLGAPSSNCHYHYKGYQQLADILFKRIGPLYYGSTDTLSLKPPDIRKAIFTDTSRSKIAVLFDCSAPAAVPADSLGNSIKNYFYLNKVPGFSSGMITSVSLSGDTLFLNLRSSTSATFVSYIPDMYASNGSTIYNGPWIRNASGLAALTFDEVPINDPDTVSVNINIKTIIEGMYLTSPGQLSRADSLTAYIRQTSFPYEIVDSAKSLIDSVSLTGQFRFFNTGAGYYYLSLKHLNALETWSKDSGIIISGNGSVYDYDFTISDAQAYGKNLSVVGERFCIYSGDVDQSGQIDLRDMILICNDSQSFIYENHIATDLNGDSFVNLNDIVICYNNVIQFIRVLSPCLSN